MPVIESSVRTKAGFPNGGASIEGSGLEAKLIYSYEAEFILQCDSIEDGPRTVVEFFNGSDDWPSLGDPYSFGNESDPFVWCTRIDPRRDPKDPYTWHVKLAWSDLKNDTQKPDEDGNKTNNPLLWRDEIDVSWQQRQAPATDAIYREGLVGTAATKYPADTVGLPLNSALQTFDPPVEREDAIRIVRWTKYLGAYNGELYETLNNAVNSAEISFDKPKLAYKDKWKQYAARIANVDARLSFENEVLHWVVTFTFLVDNKLTWRPSFLDRGLCVRAMEGDPNGRGGTVTEAQITAGQLPFLAITDKNGQQIQSPVRLNGDGRVLAPDAASVYLKYSLYPNEIPFASLNL